MPERTPPRGGVRLRGPFQQEAVMAKGSTTPKKEKKKPKQNKAPKAK
ncbi:MAG: hypothetical protein QM770_16800 [Tepidisphaeraceae bacterium]